MRERERLVRTRVTFVEEHAFLRANASFTAVVGSMLCVANRWRPCIGVSGG